MWGREAVHRDCTAEPLQPRGFAGVLGAGSLVSLEEDFRDCGESGTLWKSWHLVGSKE